MRAKKSVVVTSVLVLAMLVGLVLANAAHAAFPGANGSIVFSAGTTRGHQIFAVSPDGSGLRQMTPGTAVCVDASVSPDGKTIVFIQSINPGAAICATPMSGGDPRVVATGLFDDASFSPNGSRVVYVCDHQVWVMSADGSNQRQLTHFGVHTRAWYPAYSPKGKRIIFVAEVNAGHRSTRNRCAILAMNVNGSHLRRLAYTSKPESTWNPELNSWSPPTSGLSFSPNGRKIIYGAERYPADGVVIRVMNADGTNQRLLPGSRGCGMPCYSPDGRQIVCVNAHSQLCIANANGTHWRQLIQVTPGAAEPFWGPQAP